MCFIFVSFILWNASSELCFPSKFHYFSVLKFFIILRVVFLFAVVVVVVIDLRFIVFLNWMIFYSIIVIVFFGKIYWKKKNKSKVRKIVIFSWKNFTFTLNQLFHNRFFSRMDELVNYLLSYLKKKIFIIKLFM